jgi:uncharacterized glyoxalase superfamily protein PhnB
MIEDRIYSRLVYDDEAAAIRWLEAVFGFVEVDRKVAPGGSILAWLELSGDVVMISRSGFGLESPRRVGGISHKINVYVDDVTAHHAVAKAGGAQIARPLEDTPYGERRYEAFDLEGHRWHFTQRI